MQPFHCSKSINKRICAFIDTLYCCYCMQLVFHIRYWSNNEVHPIHAGRKIIKNSPYAHYWHKRDSKCIFRFWKFSLDDVPIYSPWCITYYKSTIKYIYRALSLAQPCCKTSCRNTPIYCCTLTLHVSNILNSIYTCNMLA